METFEIRERITQSIKGFALPSYNEIPQVGLFLEQTVKYINGYLEAVPGMAITGSMISNYVKKGIIPSPVKKQYGRDQIAYLLFVSVAKNVLSLEEIHMFIDIQKSTYTAETAYNYFVTELMGFISAIPFTDGRPKVQSNDDTFEKVMLRNTIIAIVHKLYLDMFFVEVEHERSRKAD